MGIRVVSKAIKNFISEFIEKAKSRAAVIRTMDREKSWGFFLFWVMGKLAVIAKAESQRVMVISATLICDREVDVESERVD